MNKPLGLRINKWLYLFFSIASFITGVLLIVLSSKENRTQMTWVSVFFFLVSTFTMNAFFSKVIVFKAHKKNVVKEYYDLVKISELVERLKNNKFIFKKNKFGYVALKIDGEVCYKITIVEKNEIYFSDDENKVDKTPTKGIENVKKLIGFEFYKEDTNDLFTRAENLSFCGDKVFYEAFCLDYNNNQIIEANVIEKKDFEDEFNKFIGMLGIVKKGA